MSTNPLPLGFGPSSRPTDPETSHLAADAARKRGPSQRGRVWDALLQLGNATDYELAQKAGILRTSAAKRRQELQALGLVEPTTLRRLTDTGSPAVVWRPSSSSACPF